MHRVGLAVLALLTVACADRTALLVEVSSPDLAIPRDIDSLTIRARTPSGAMFDQTFDVNMGWPHSLTIRPADTGDEGQVFVEVTGNHAGAFVVRRVTLTAFQPGVTRRVDISLQASCVDVHCGPDVDCVAGHCDGPGADAGVDGGADASTGDTGIDVDAAMFDGGDMDAGIIDAGTFDAGDMDAGTFDGGTDAGVRDTGVDTGVDAGMRDTGTDVGVDAAMPVDSGGSAGDCTGTACLGAVVISELTTAGAGSALDEFVELYNRGMGTATVGGCVITYHSASGATRTVRATIPAGAAIPSHHYYLLASTTYASSPAADFVWPGTTGAADTGGTISLECSGTVMDRVGYGTGMLAEGVSITPTMPSGGSYERKANAASTAASMSTGGADVTAGNSQDTDHNEADIVVRTLRDPQSSASSPEP